MTVYQFTDTYAPEDRGETSNPTIRAAFDLDYNKTRVLTYGFHACRYDPESGGLIKRSAVFLYMEYPPHTALHIHPERENSAKTERK